MLSSRRERLTGRWKSRLNSRTSLNRSPQSRKKRKSKESRLWISTKRRWCLPSRRRLWTWSPSVRLSEPVVHLHRKCPLIKLLIEMQDPSERGLWLIPSCSEPVHEDKNIARYMVDYLLRRRYIKTAKAVTQSAGIEVRQLSVPSYSLGKQLMSSNWST